MFLLSLYDTTANVSVQQQKQTLQVFLFYIGKGGYSFSKGFFFFLLSACIFTFL